MRPVLANLTPLFRLLVQTILPLYPFISKKGALYNILKRAPDHRPYDRDRLIYLYHNTAWKSRKNSSSLAVYRYHPGFFPTTSGFLCHLPTSPSSKGSFPQWVFNREGKISLKKKNDLPKGQTGRQKRVEACDIQHQQVKISHNHTQKQAR